MIYFRENSIDHFWYHISFRYTYLYLHHVPGGSERIFIVISNMIFHLFGHFSLQFISKFLIKYDNQHSGGYLQYNYESQ